MTRTQAGYGEEKITPTDNNHYLAGYIMRAKPMTGVHDDIYVRALVLDGPDSPLVIIQLDLLCIDKHIHEDLEGIAEKALGKSVVVVAASHTHSAPSTIYRDPLHRIGLGRFRRDYYELVIEKTRQALEQAVENREPAQAWTASVEVKGVATDRNDPCRPVDQRTVVLGLDTGRKNIMLINYPVHPTVLGPDNLLITRDLIGPLQDTIEWITGYKTIYLNGAAANISTRFTRKNRSFSEAERLGRLAATQIIETVSLGRRRPLMIDEVHAITRKIELRMKRIEDIMGLASLIETSVKLKLKEEDDPAKKRALQAQLDAVKAIKDFADLLAEIKITGAEITALSLGGEIGIITWPGEIHSKASRILRETTGYSEIMFVGYANEYTGYLVPEDKGEITYESLMQIFEPGAFEKAVDNMRALLEEARRI